MKNFLKRSKKKTPQSESPATTEPALKSSAVEAGPSAITVKPSVQLSRSQSYSAAPAIEVDDIDVTSGAEEEDAKPERLKPPDLWQLAYERSGLEASKIAILRAEDGEKDEERSLKNFVERVKNLTQERRVECERSGWIDHNTKKIAFAQQAQTVLTAVLELRELVSAGLKFDVTGYGAAAWSAVTFGLQLVQNDLDRTLSLMDASAFLADTLARYASIETNYGDPEIGDWIHMQECIVDVYASVLKYAVEVTSVCRNDTTDRVIASFRALAEKPLETLRTEISEHDTKVEKWMKLISDQCGSLWLVHLVVD
ncbi:hypothetical protein CC80DRAFT_26127 [Byssothecium circinans]|uniref:DUF7708 domain-containing protein n=1 Tax=Byssothecium circinans TaxID=147558 RepID=A0A6A5U0R3_9PLEO|nr:hypothetical protein CC80DRAFT_26127 [Byssothecium circinans]